MPSPQRETPRRDPAWAWYLAAVAIVVGLVLAHMAGVLDRFGP